jgi:hypothetical protein
MAVSCVSCDEELDLTQVNWLVNTRPWCPRCAHPYTDLLGGTRGVFRVASALLWIASAVMTFVFQLSGVAHGRWRWGRKISGAGDPTRPGDYRRNPPRGIQVQRVEPEDAPQHFAPFFHFVR